MADIDMPQPLLNTYARICVIELGYYESSMLLSVSANSAYRPSKEKETKWYRAREVLASLMSTSSHECLQVMLQNRDAALCINCDSVLNNISKYEQKLED